MVSFCTDNLLLTCKQHLLAMCNRMCQVLWWRSTCPRGRGALLMVWLGQLSQAIHTKEGTFQFWWGHPTRGWWKVKNTLHFLRCKLLQCFIFTPYQRHWYHVGTCSLDFLKWKHCLTMPSINYRTVVCMMLSSKRINHCFGNISQDVSSYFDDSSGPTQGDQRSSYKYALRHGLAWGSSAKPSTPKKEHIQWSVWWGHPTRGWLKGDLFCFTFVTWP